MVMNIAAAAMRLLTETSIGLFGTAIAPGRDTIMEAPGIIPAPPHIRILGPIPARFFLSLHLHFHALIRPLFPTPLFDPIRARIPLPGRHRRHGGTRGNSAVALWMDWRASRMLRLGRS